MKEKNKKTLKILIFVAVVIGVLIINIVKSNQEVQKNNANTTSGFELLAESDFRLKDTLKLGYPTMLDIGGAECVPCKAMASVLVELNEELMGKAIIKFVDYWKYPHLAEQFEFEVIPTQFFYDKDGKLHTKHQGQITKEKVIDIFKEMGYEFDE